MVVTSNGRPIAILAAITEANLEESLSAFRRARAVEAVVSLQRRSVERGMDKISLDEINAEMNLFSKSLLQVKLYVLLQEIKNISLLNDAKGLILFRLMIF
jgi:antitoxin (DNA-binding transcriptional repressor) of toxin-antitoxin stability system